MELCPRQWHEEIRVAQIAVILRDLVLEHEVITKGVVGEFGEKPVVLMSVTHPMGQDQRRVEVAFDGLEAVLDVGALKREIPVAKTEYLDLLFTRVFEKRGGAFPRLDSAQAGGAEDDPPHEEMGHFSREAQNCPAAPDLDIVGMRPQAEQLQRSSRRWRKNEGEHATAPLDDREFRDGHV